MCDFKPGDEIVCIDDANQMANRPKVVKDRIYVVHSVFPSPQAHAGGAYKVGDPIVSLEGMRHEYAPGREAGYRASRFRKVQRRDLSAWLETSTDFEEPKRDAAPAKKRERA